jgi:L-2-hydroxyglutarate oxidase
MANTFDVIIAGAGAVGLSTAYQLLNQNPRLKVAVIEKENGVAKHQTGNNSGVIHSGIYYKPGSLKAINCINGYNQLLEFAGKYGIPFDLCGKLIVATKKEELPLLDMLYERGKTNGLNNIQKFSPEQAKEIEPYVNCISAVRVPQTGIIDYKLVAQTLANCIIENGGTILLNEAIINIASQSNGKTSISTSQNTYETKYFINCTGLYTDKTAELSHINPGIKIIPFRGEYYMLKEEKQYLVKHLIYPVPNPEFPFLGVHFTRMIGGGIEAGPNAVLAFKREGYKKTNINFKELFETLSYSGFHQIVRKYWRDGMAEMYRSWSKKAFTKSLQALVPDIQESDLLPGGAGVRAQACDPKGNLLDDFSIIKHGNTMHVLNAPSPAATSCLSIGKHLAEKIFE